MEDLKGFTPADMPPEIMKVAVLKGFGDKKCWPQNDLWPLGMIAYELLHQISDKEQWQEFKNIQGDIFLEAKARGPSKSLIQRYAEAARNFEVLVAKEHPHLFWLHGLLKVDPLKRTLAAETLQVLKAYRQGLPAECPVLPVPKRAREKLSARAELRHTILQSEIRPTQDAGVMALIATYASQFFSKLGELYSYYFPSAKK